MKKLLVAVMFVLFGSQVLSQDYYRGLGAYESEDYEVALKEFRPLAKQGHMEAQNYLVICIM